MSYAYRGHHGTGGAHEEWHPSYPRYQVAEPQTAPLRVGALLNWSGAALSLALLAGLGLWSWQLMVRDVSGVPVVRALEGPMRVAPEDVGGQQAQYQGLSVNQIAAGAPGDAGGKIVLAPPPVSLRDEDAPLGSAANVTSEAAATPPPQRDAALVEAAWRPETASAPAESAAVPPPPGSVTALEQSPRPPVRPAGLRRPAGTTDNAAPDEDIAMAVASSVAARIGPRGGREVDPASLRPGMRLVQLGTFPSEEAARDAWSTLSQRFRPYLDEYGRVIEAAHSGGSVFYRLRAHGFENEAEARGFCAILIDQNADCIPVLLR